MELLLTMLGFGIGWYGLTRWNRWRTNQAEKQLLHEVPESCPKCGNACWLRPTHHNRLEFFHAPECMSYKCRNCFYRARVRVPPCPVSNSTQNR